MARCALQTPPRVAHAKPPGPTMASYANVRSYFPILVDSLRTGAVVQECQEQEFQNNILKLTLMFFFYPLLIKIVAYFILYVHYLAWAFC